MKIPILKIGQYKDKQINEFNLLDLEDNTRGKELLGGLSNIKTNKLDPVKVSHIIKDVIFNKLTSTLECTVECLPTPYGKQLNIFLQKFKDKVTFNPIYTYEELADNTIKNLRLHSVMALITKESK